ncbi:MAG TPA: S41 family peptidase [Candidatus Gastranaerophilaceae bacterium]|nr:S41 family peptidase [Candidatus Gastranaerophilaceae bacterium]HPT40943.1 S41 family peptidase [Candidatus Gastranaerophilaceae bacterium]
MKKQVIIFIFLVFALLLFNNFLLKQFSYNSAMISSKDLVDKRQINSQKLFENSWRIIKNNFYDSSMNHQDWKRWKKHYKGKIKTDEDANVAINTILASLDDPYSRFLNQKEYADQNISIDSKISGIGVNIASLGGKTYVVSVIEGTPAYKANLKVKDIIMKVDGKDISGLEISEVASLVRGKENTTVNLVILRGKKKIQKNIIRKEIKIKTVKSSVEKNIGYIQILSFIGSETSEEFIQALEKTQNTDGLIIDLRGNTGGLLPNAVFIANMFIDKGNIVSVVGRNGYRQRFYAQQTDFVIDKPLLVLVDGGSASASEILSGALKDYHKAKLIGTKTFGKGMVQKIIPMPNMTGINLTIAKYLTPAGHDINKIGIEPDIKVDLTQKDILANDDVQLDTAKAMMKKMLEKIK